jgi:DNA helicase-2/ATP-dependent DNA helicase PcrA
MKPEELFDILDELQESARSFSTFDQWFFHMEEYREELKRQSLGNSENHIDSVQIVTMHSAKGLEFEVVFIPDANEGITPHKKAVLEADIEEERRLFYVAMTRAINRLYILCSKERYNKTLARSRFLDEIEQEEAGRN